MLGDYIYDNTNDNNHEFLISAAIGGVYSNESDRSLEIALDESLCNNAEFASTGDPILLMPPNYYTLSSPNALVIPKGKYNGGIKVHLNDAFFNDPLAIGLNYVIPIRLVRSSDVDTILQGSSSKTNPDPRIAGDWNVVPKNYTMFAVKYINPYHGKYLHRGVAVVKDASNAVLETNPYRTTYIVDNEIWSLVTTAYRQVSVTGTIRSTALTGTINMLLTFTDNGTCTVTGETSTAYTITGTGKFAEDADTWGNKERDAIHITYQFTDGVNTYNATDTLVIRDRAVVLETFSPTVN